MEKIKAKRLLLAGDSWMDRKTWYEEIFDSEQVTNLAVTGSGNKYIAESVISHITSGNEVDHVLVCWSGLNRIDVPMPLGARPGYVKNESQRRETWASRYWTNYVAPWRDSGTKLQIDEPFIRMMYQEKGYVSVKNQALINVLNLQNFLKVKQIPYLFCFLYDYTNQDFDHNHLTGENDVGNFATLGSVSGSHPILAEIDRENCLEPTGLEWALEQEKEYFIDPIHFTDEGYQAWAKQMFENYITKPGRQE